MGHRTLPRRHADRAAAAVLTLLLGSLLAVLGLTSGPVMAQTPAPPPSAAVPAPTATATTVEGIAGTLANAGTPLPGVTIVAERDGARVGTVQTGPNGRWRIPVPGPGTYTVRIDNGTLPEGLAVRVDTRQVTVGENQANAPALFLVGASFAKADTRLDRTPQLLVGGFQFGLVLAMASIGLSLIFGTTGLTNFAHGELVTGGAILGWVFNVKLGLNLIPATLIAILVAGVAGAALDRGLWRPLRRRGTGLIAALIVSIGLAFVLRYVILFFYGGSSRSYEQYATQSPVDVGPVGILPRDMVIMAISIIVLVGIGLGLQRTRFGKATRAVADNPALAASSGIDVDRVITIVWVVGTALAALGGIFLGLSQQVGWQMGQNVLLLLFASITLGGLGTAYGALVGALVIGMFTQLSTLFIPAELQVVAALLILIVVLIVRPQGILGSKERVG
ncbi:MAG: Branched-chain amino acid ABC-type transport system, permease component [Frankiales bacterium]|nr:Branched-chain amino acid ABC-type transport system, permease component [Frankiales bacterium]